MYVVAKRKKEVLDLLEEIERYPATSNFKQEMMVFAYVLVCAAIEFMIENTLQDWLNKIIRHHKKSSYRGRKYVQYFLEVQSSAREKNIDDFHSTKLELIRKIIKDIAGQECCNKFNLLFQNSQQSNVLQPDITARLDRITRVRHETAHGQKMPNDIQPNITELKEDFKFVYEHIIKNVKACLPKVPKV